MTTSSFPHAERLEPDPEPAVPVLASRVAARGHRIGEDEERGPAAASRAELLDEPGALAVEHRLEPRAADVVIGRAVQRVAHRHVVRRDRLRDGACGAADAEEPASDLLPGAISAKVPYLAASRLIQNALSCVLHARPACRASCRDAAETPAEGRASCVVASGSSGGDLFGWRCPAAAERLVGRDQVEYQRLVALHSVSSDAYCARSASSTARYVPRPCTYTSRASTTDRRFSRQRRRARRAGCAPCHTRRGLSSTSSSAVSTAFTYPCSAWSARASCTATVARSRPPSKMRQLIVGQP